MTWNLWFEHGPWAQRRAAIERVIVREAPDVICLQEVSCTRRAGVVHTYADDLADRLGFHVHVSDGPWFARRDTTDGAEMAMGNAILSRWPIVEPGQITLPGLDNGPEYRKAVFARIDAPSGRWPVVCTHLNHRFDESAVRVRQVDAVADVVVGLRGDPSVDPPVVVAGDFNAVPDSDEIRRLTGRTAPRHVNLVFNDCWELRGEGRGSTWRADNAYQADANWPDRRLDYVFVSWPRPKPMGHPSRVWLAGIEPEDVDGTMVQPSDHAAVVVDLRVG